MVVNGYHIKLGKVINFAFSTLSSHSVSTEALEVPITKISQLHIVDLLHISHRAPTMVCFFCNGQKF